MKKGKKFRETRESDISDIKLKQIPKKKKKIHLGPKKQHFSKYSIESYEEEE